MKIYLVGKENITLEGEPNELVDFIFIWQEKNQSNFNKKMEDLLSTLFPKEGTS